MPALPKTGRRIPVSRTASQIRPFIVMEVMEKAFALENEGRSIVHLEVGEPDFETPEVIREAGIRAIRDGHTHYTHSLGLPALREAIAEWQHEHYGIGVSPEQIIVTTGSSAAMLLVFAAILDPESQVLLADPGYSCYPKFVLAFNGQPVSIPVREMDSYQYDPDELERALESETRAVMLNSPSNPTGTVASSEFLAEVSARVEGKALLISDEIYHGLVYGGSAHSILEYTAEAIVINGFSKLFAMTGWRLGYAIVPPELVRPIQKLQQNLFISAPDFAQHAALAALKDAGEEVEAMRKEYDRRRKYVLKSLRDMGLHIAVEPTGAFYIFVNVSQYTQNVYEFAFEILEKAGVAVTPGIDFGSNGEGYVRICYANSMANIETAMDRLSRFFRGLE